jgi:hypothetical protein
MPPAFNRPYGTKKSLFSFGPSDKSLGYFQATLWVENIADIILTAILQ